MTDSKTSRPGLDPIGYVDYTSTSQISPRLGTGAVDIRVLLAERIECGKFGIARVVGGCMGRLLGKDRIALRQRQLEKLRRGPVLVRCPRSRLFTQLRHERQDFAPVLAWYLTHRLQELVLANSR